MQTHTGLALVTQHAMDNTEAAAGTKGLKKIFSNICDSKIVIKFFRVFANSTIIHLHAYPRPSYVKNESHSLSTRRKGISQFGVVMLQCCHRITFVLFLKSKTGTKAEFLNTGKHKNRSHTCSPVELGRESLHKVGLQELDHEIYEVRTRMISSI